MEPENETIARTIYESIFEERWKDLHENGIEKALYRQVAATVANKIDELRGHP